MKTQKSTTLVKVLTFCLAGFTTLSAITSCTKENTANSLNGQALSNRTDDAASNLSQGLVAWYSFKNGSTKDLSGNGNDVIVNNATPTADRHGNPNAAYSFNGIDNYMRVANSTSLNPDKAITLAAIVKVNDFYSGKCHGNRIVNKGYDDSQWGSYHLGFSDNYFYQNTQCDNDVRKDKETFDGVIGNGLTENAGTLDTTEYIKTGEWYGIAYTYDGSVAKLYVNGKLKYTKQQTLNIVPNSDDLFIGMMNIDNTLFPYWFNGVIDELRIYNRALTTAELKKLVDNY